MAESNFTATVVVNEMVDGQLKEPQLAFGPSPCTFLKREDSKPWSTLTWTCNYPGINSKEKVCEQSFQNVLRPQAPSTSSAASTASNGPTTSNQSSSNSSSTLFNYLPGYVDMASAPLADLDLGLSVPL